MAERTVVRLPNQVLADPAGPVGPVRGDDDLHRRERLAADLVDTMRASPGCVGLAAPQIGVSLRACCLDVSSHPKVDRSHGLLVLFDPELLQAEGDEVAREGCMSVPDFTADVRRAARVVVRGSDEAGEERLVVAEGFEARALQHELDHLDGRLILDRVARLERDVFRRKAYKPPPRRG